MSKFVGLIILSLALYAPAGQACSAFCLKGKETVIVGKSYDWYFGHGHGAMYTNPRGIERTTLVLDEAAPNPAHWTSKYGSVTFTQFGRGVPISGMNEKGLVVELLQLETAVYNSHETDKPYVNEAQWAQYQLDHYASVDEVLAHARTLRIEKAYTGIHYFIADASGRSATVDFVDGKIVVHEGANLPVAALTNDPYADLIADSDHRNLGAPRGAFDPTSEDRFHRARQLMAQTAKTADDELPRLGWKILNAVRLRGFAADALMEPSQWNILHRVNEGLITLKTRAARAPKFIDLKKVALAEGSPEMMMDMNEDAFGDALPMLRPYSFAANKILIEKNNWLFKLSGQGAKVRPAVEYGRRACDPILAQ